MSASSGMAGKSFKGNLEVLNLSDIFQSLAMNRHSGTLIVTDGKREKKIFFAEGEITLLSSSRRQRLGELLVAEGRISEDELELALKLQKQSKKRLGEILVEEGFCTEDDIDRLVRMQIEEEIYDLFLWKRAEFEFIADQMPEDMARESPNLTRLAFNTNSLIMEALRRLDEWSLIRNLVPTTKEVFVLIDPDALHAAQVPERMRDDARRMIDARTTVEGLAERFLVSEFEMCKHLAEMVQAGAIRGLTEEELADKADEAYALNDFSAAASLYGRLAEYFPEAAKILIPLADSLRRTGAEKQALVIYEQLAKQLESKGDQDRLRRCYEAITQLDPSRVDLARKLEEMDWKQLTARSGRRFGLTHVLILLIVVGGGGLGLAYMKQRYGEDAVKVRDAEAARQLLVEHDDAKIDSQQSKKEEDYRRWFEKGRELWTRYPSSPEAQKVEFPLLVSSVPAGFKVYAGTPGNLRPKGITKPDEPFLECTYEPASRVLIELRRADGEGEPLWSQPFETKEWLGVIRPVVTERPTLSCQDDFRLDASVAWSKVLGAWLTPSRRGVLRALRPNDLGSLAGWDGLVLGEQGDVFSDPVVIPVGGGERLLVGASEGGVLAIDLGSAPGSDPVQRRYPTSGSVAAAPLFVPPAQVEHGRVVVVSTVGEIKAYTLEGGAPAWSANAEAAVRFAPLPLKGNGCLIAADDATVTVYEATDGKVRWSVEVGAISQAAPQLVGPDRVLLTLQGGKLVLLSAEGRELGSWNGAPGKQVVACADPAGERVFLSAGEGKLLALQGKDLKPAWEGKSIAIPLVPSTRLGVRGTRLLVASGYPAGSEPTEKDPAIQAFECSGGRLVWQASFYPALAGRVLRLTITDQGSFVSTSARSLHHFSDEGY